MTIYISGLFTLLGSCHTLECKLSFIESVALESFPVQTEISFQSQNTLRLYYPIYILKYIKKKAMSC